MTVEAAADATADGTNAGPLDVVVLGGGGHVGLPLSLALADAGLRVGIFDINGATLDAHRGAAEMPFLENGADELLAARAPHRAAWSSSDSPEMHRVARTP